MTSSAYAIAAVIAVLFAICLIALRQKGRQLAATQREKDDILGEELRMFDFLHHLGEVIGKDISSRQLYKEIVEGFSKVLGADGGALYFLTEDQKYLTPKYISKDCPPLVGVPVEIRQRAKKDSRALASHLRLSKVGAAEGVLGATLTGGECLMIPNVKDHESFKDSFVSYDENVTALLAPLQYSGRDIGVVAIVRRHSSSASLFTGNDFEVFRSASEQSAFALGNAMIHRELVEKRKLDDEIRTAREVQNVLLPSEEPIIPGYRVSGSNTPARMISGDYFDYIELDENQTGVVIADVTGKGVPAGLLMAMCRSVLRLTAKTSASPSEALVQVNRNLFPDVREDMFVSLAYVVLEHGSGNLKLARAGHDPPMMFRSDTGTIENIKPPGLAIGIDEGEVFERVTKDLELEMASGDCLLFYTDGVCEAENRSEGEFGKERLKDVFLKSAPLGSEAVVESVRRAVADFSGDIPQMDDITMIAIEKR
ncbi:SpoIIE family protein phosphatase [Verrucomicrobiaceae bacterium 5K15]|uniref:SpoIIE family protein phosphatase n=1 Tax=Oceaniferula flava TaxID=2800421 RepID=A0AAE2V951_9BACT|nr:SpoIIE family protein phosphatase [Oceaniferula flavus]MBK1856497.1 SpoIIE family protein phosphatase [Oceaniferula flavus]MBM1137804.1 SpoIIE family protein phosphatase [Oceaniferula flavus]